jgi:hypothetical protein
VAVTLLVTVDTEEEFDWAKPISPRNRSVKHMAELSRLQDLFDSLRVRPTYVVDHPIVTDERSAKVLREFLRRGNCEIGAHVHPWVNPPTVEEITPRNSYLCNLPLTLQQEKVAELTRLIHAAFDVKPTAFKAGRYGLDFALVPYLQELGYTVDSSVIAYSNFEHDGGPSFDDFDPTPFRLGPPLVPSRSGHPAMLEVPSTVGFSRRPFAWWARVHRTLAQDQFHRLHPIGILWHLRVVRKTTLTPELSGLSEMITLMRVLANDRSREVVLNVTMHSPSVEAGHTPFVKTAEDLGRFFSTLRGALEFAVRDLSATPMTLSEYQTQFLKAEIP